MIRSKAEEGLITDCTVFSPDAPGNYPSILWLHGLNSTWYREGLGKQLNEGHEVKAVVYCPANPSQGDWSKNEIKDLVQLITKGNHLWHEVYGYSQGGMGVMGALNHFASFWKLAGIIAGKTGLKDYESYKNVIIRAWHGKTDRQMGFSICKFIEGVAAIGGDATLIEYNEAHDIDEEACSLTDPESIWKWRESKIRMPEPEPEPLPQPASLEALNGELFVVIAGMRYKLSVTLTEV